MKRDVQKMSNTIFDVLIIGGGISGAAIAWDAALRGLRVGLVEMGDFGRGASSATSKYVHGGLRYLRQMELNRMRDSLRERCILSGIAPHLIQPMPFLAPTYGWRRRLALQATARLYNTLSYKRYRKSYADPKIPSVQSINRKAVLQREPHLPADNLAGGMLYYNGQLYDPTRHLLAFLHSATAHNAQVANYTEVVEFVVEGDAVQGAVVHDRLTDQTYTLRGRITVNATGPWTDFVLDLLDETAPLSVDRVKSIHIVTRPIARLDQALALRTPAGQPLFILPWRGHALIGALDAPFEGHPDDLMVTEADLRDVLSTINATFPPARLTRDDVLHFYVGPHPIIDGHGEGDTYTRPQKYNIHDHAEDGLRNLFSVLGGTYTTARGLAERLVDHLFEQLDDRPPVPCTTHVVPLFGGDTGPFDRFLAYVQQRYEALPEATALHLARSYGTRMADILAHARRGPVLMTRPSERTPDIMAQVDYAVMHEMAQTLDDVLFRRTGIGTLGEPSLDTLEAVAQRMAGLHEWDSQRFDDEVETMRERYRPALSPKPASA